MSKEIQMSAFISSSTKALLERYVRATGVKKSHLVETALRHHLQALQELPSDVVIAPRLVVSLSSGQAISKRLRSRRPTKALRDLMKGDGD